jgi:uncharacterized membrane protein
MPLRPKTKTALRVSTVIITAVVSAAVSFIGAIVGLQGGNFWPWVWAMGVLYGAELIYLSIVAVTHFRSNEQRRRRQLYRRRKATRLPL